MARKKWGVIYCGGQGGFDPLPAVAAVNLTARRGAGLYMLAEWS